MPGRYSRRLPRRALLAAVPLAALASAARARARRPIEVVHWWISGGESAAIRIIRRALEADGWSWQDVAVAGPDVAKAAAITRVLGGQPPTTMLWFVGQDLAELHEDGTIRDLQAVAEAEGWDRALPAELSRRMKVGGKFVVAPADLHCSNWTFAHNGLMQSVGVEIPTTWPEVLAICPKLRDAGIIPIAFGGQPWQESSVFVMVLTGTGGAKLHRAVIAEHDLAAAESPEMVETFRIFGALKPFVDKASPNRSWADSAKLLSLGKAALYFSGDWARGDFEKAGLKPQIDYTCRSAPGNAGIFSATVDAFVMPRTDDPDVVAAQDAFARVTMNPQVQHDFNLAKGAIPPRTDVALTGYDACAQQSAHLYLNGGVVVPSSSMGMTTAMRQAMYDVVHRFWSTDDADPKMAARDLRMAIERTRS